MLGAFKKKMWVKSNQSMLSPERLTVEQAREEFEFCFNMWAWVADKRKVDYYDCPDKTVRLKWLIKKQCQHDQIVSPEWLRMKFFIEYKERTPECLEVIEKGSELVKKKIQRKILAKKVKLGKDQNAQ
jgi:hypothetical protein